MNKLTRCISVKVFGLVHGVCFRACTKEMARNLGLSGFVKNESDGTVYIEAIGNGENIKHFIEWCRKGSPKAEVSKIDVAEIEEKKFEGFEIRY